MKKLKKPKVFIPIMLLMIYVLSKVDTREGHENKSNHIHKYLARKKELKKLENRINRINKKFKKQMIAK